ncbi:MAG TPA: hypothetical protein QGF27_16485 [Arenicellales bacterium]|mgnify:FL=1|nr:hypothetical protein [Acidobacteriota bacterium]HJP11620.1 hypothetical protein [Arenicellales bacterium]|tara:strand:- start:32311 stop:34206 length:1896 start_codon:yes stop_codon:yes gene_type:complete
MPHSRRHRTTVTIILGAALILTYPVVGNVLLFSGAIERLVSLKPEKLTVQWHRAWTLFPGRLYVEGLDLDIQTKRHRVRINVDKGALDLSLLKLITRTVDIQNAHGEGIHIEHARQSRAGTVKLTDTAVKAKAHSESTTTNASTANESTQATSEGKPPWTIHLQGISASNVRTIQLDELNLQGRGELKNLTMHLITRGGPMRIDNVDLEMTAQAPTSHDNTDGTLTVEANLTIAENIPRQNRGKSLLQFVSGQIKILGDVQSLGHIDVMPGKRYNLGVSGAGHIDLKLHLEKGAVTDGSRIDFQSKDFQTDFLAFQAAGHGRIIGEVNQNTENSVKLRIELDHFNLGRSDDPLPYLQGQDLVVDFRTDQLLLHHQEFRENSEFSFDIQDATISDLTHYNRYLPQQTGVRILSGIGDFKGGMTLKGAKAHGSMQLAGSDVVLAVRGRKVRTDLKLVANLSDGHYDGQTYRLKDTYFRLYNTKFETALRETKDDWWAEIRVDKGKLLWRSPMDVDAQMSLAMRDVEPLIAAIRDPAKKESVLEKALNVKNLEGVLTIETNQNNITLDPILIDGKGLKIISRLDILPNSVSGVLYAKLRGLSANFEITNSKARFRGLGGREKVLRQVRPITGNP